jgi:hypothetical protein
VIWGVDFYAFDERFVGFRHPETRVGLEGDERQMMAMLIKETLLSLQAFDDRRKVIRRAARGHTPGLYAVPMPWPEETIRARLADPGRPGLAQTDDASLRAQLVNWVGNYSEYRPSAAPGDYFCRTVAGVRVAGSTSSCSCRCSAAASSRSWTRRAAGAAFQTWKRQILDAGPYWDFSGFGKLDAMESLFLEAAHFWPAVGHTMLRQFLGLGCGPCGATAETIRAAGVGMDRSTVDAHLGRQETARTAVQRQGNRCARVDRGDAPEVGRYRRDPGWLRLGARAWVEDSEKATARWPGVVGGGRVRGRCGRRFRRASSATSWPSAPGIGRSFAC